MTKTTATGWANTRPASAMQWAAIDRLIGEVTALDAGSGKAAADWSARNANSLCVSAAHNWMTRLINRRNALRAEANANAANARAALVDGNYAINLGGDEIHYFRLTRKVAKASGFPYLKVQERASEELYPVDRNRARMIIDLIAADPTGAAQLYAQTLGRCWKCHQALTDAASRAAGIGPDCASKS